MESSVLAPLTTSVSSAYCGFPGRADPEESSTFLPLSSLFYSSFPLPFLSISVSKGTQPLQNSLSSFSHFTYPTTNSSISLLSLSQLSHCHYFSLLQSILEIRVQILLFPFILAVWFLFCHHAKETFHQLTQKFPDFFHIPWSLYFLISLCHFVFPSLISKTSVQALFCHHHVLWPLYLTPFSFLVFPPF